VTQHPPDETTEFLVKDGIVSDQAGRNQASAVAAAEHQHELLGMTPPAGEGLRAEHPEAQWFPNAALGLFLHWGLSSVSGACDLSWGMIKNTPWDAHLDGHNKLAPRDYYALAERWNPPAYDPDKWLRAARRAGFRYAVLTTKHHDGYTLWPSRHGSLGTHTHMDGRDLVGPFVEACRANDLKVGLYYSPPDWYFDRDHRSWGMMAADQKGQAYDFDHQLVPARAVPAEHEARRVQLARGQIRELLTRYGRIDLFWLDGGADEVTAEEVRAIQPHVIINSRIGDAPGDYDHTECRMPTSRFAGWFETCNTWNSGSWGHTKAEVYGPAADRLKELALLRAWGGNLLTNVAPLADGQLPDVVYERFKELEAWMAHSGEAIYDVRAGPYPEGCNVPAACTEDHAYLYFRPEDPAEAEIKVARGPRPAQHLRTGRAIEVAGDGDVVRITLPRSLRSQTVEVVKLNW